MFRHSLLAASLLAPAACLCSTVCEAQPPAGAVRDLLEKVVVERDVVYGRAGERELKLDLVKPRNPGAAKLPVAVFIHGGGWRAGDKAAGLPRVAPLAATGDYVGVSVGYRLSGEAVWPAQIHDCKAAIRWVRANADKLGIDPEKIGVWGTSAGGHLVSLLGASGDVEALEGENGSPGHSSRVACVVNFCGPTDFTAILERMPAGDAPAAVTALLGGTLAEKRDEAKAASPVTWVSKDAPPFLHVHGTDDKTVPIGQAERLHAALRKAGVDSTLVKIEGGGHAIGGPEVARRVEAFLAKHLRGQDVEVSGEPIQP
jgi:acetyl esterase/lipase